MDNPRGRILSLTHDANPPRAVVEVTTSLRCARCVAGKGCGAGLIGGSSEPRRIDAQVASGLDLREGDEVRIELAPDDLLHASLLAYGLPLAGAVIGAGAGHYMASKQQQYASEEERIDSMIADVRSDNAKLARLNDSAMDVIAADLAKIEKIDGELAQGKITAEEARGEMVTVDENRRYLRTTLTNLKTRHEEWERVSARVRRSGDYLGADQLDREIGKLERQITGLQGELDTLSERRRISRVG